MAELGGDGYRTAVAVVGPLAPHWRLAVAACSSRRLEIRHAAEPRLGDLEGRDQRDAGLHLVWMPTSAHQLDLLQRTGQEDRRAGVRERSGWRRFHQPEHDIDASHTALGWTLDWGGATQAHSLQRGYGSRVEVNNTRTPGVTVLRPQTLDDRVLEGRGSVVPAAGRLYTAGFEWRGERLDNPALAGGRGQARHQALLGQAALDLALALALALTLALTVGLRPVQHDRLGGA